MAVKHGPCLLTEKRIQTFETKFMRKLLCISYSEHKTNDCVRSKINFLLDPVTRSTVTSSATVRRRKLARFGHVTRYDSLSKTIFQGTLEGGRRRGRQRKFGMHNVTEWTSLQCQNCSQWPPVEKTGRGSLPNRSSCPRRPYRSKD